MVAQPYGKQVLIGNWADRRYAYDEKGNGILPGLNPAQKCEEHRSLSQDTYTYEGFSGDECLRHFKEKRVTRIHNFRNGTSSNLKMIDNPMLKNNFTTTNTLLYDWLPKHQLNQNLKRQLTTAEIPTKQNYPDLMQCFGNLTRTRNFAELQKAEEILEKTNAMQTTYDTAYNLSSKLTPDYEALANKSKNC
ncbi:uncharacterized protein LOC133840054 [Drosophila sulfurigaster albostrigata]|uniref:uncharacterized protein LOC133840054 n=1 Tax=Drosophila sulfurigaster albostrigata TaxID=89887 RepID=UPI002D21A640|nr:uncharacterized protein LOC133840054 [Drosophila sulfurigaster albostrigata]